MVKKVKAKNPVINWLFAGSCGAERSMYHLSALNFLWKFIELKKQPEREVDSNDRK